MWFSLDRNIMKNCDLVKLSDTSGGEEMQYNT